MTSNRLVDLEVTLRGLSDGPDDLLRRSVLGAGEVVFDGLKEAVENSNDSTAHDLIARCTDHAQQTRLFEHLAMNPTFGSERTQIAARLVANLKALIATARFAMVAKADPRESVLLPLAETALSSFTEFPFRERDGGHSEEFGELPGTAGVIGRVLLQWELVGKPIVGALFWSLFWLDYDNSVRDADAQLMVPLCDWNQDEDGGNLERLHLERLKPGRHAVLIEHPLNALVPVAPDLISSVCRCWSLVQGQCASWRFVAPDDQLYEGESLSLAVAVGFILLGRPIPVHRHDCVVLGLLDTNGRLKPVGFLRKKLEYVKGHGISLAAVVFPEENRANAQADDGVKEEDIARFRERGLNVRKVGSLLEATRVAEGTDSSAFSINTNDTILAGKYVLHEKLDLKEDVWRGRLAGEDLNGDCLIKLWGFGEEEGSAAFEFRQRNWALELRNASRLSGSPGAEEYLLLLREAAVDRELKAFAMVMNSNSGGYTPLARFLRPVERRRHEWICLERRTKTTVRQALWNGLARVAAGLRLLHDQHIVHFNVGAESVYCSESGPESFRLGGFEWSLRLGGTVEPEFRHPSSWVVPPECLVEDAAYEMGSDWYGFGVLAARCLLPIENFANQHPVTLNAGIYRIISESAHLLSDAERDLLMELLRPQVSERLRDASIIQFYITEILRTLRVVETPAIRTNVAFGVVLPSGDTLTRLANAASNEGFYPDKNDPEAHFVHAQDRHMNALRQWLEQDIEEPLLFAIPGTQPLQYGMKGKRLVYRIYPYRRPGTEIEDWSLAFLQQRDMVPEFLPDDHQVTLKSIKPRVYIPRFDLKGRLPPSRSWLQVLPQPSPPDPEREPWLKFEQFLRVTNQIDLLMRRHEIFPYICDPEGDYRIESNGTERLTIHEAEGGDDLTSVVGRRFGMLDFLAAEMEAGRAAGGNVVLHPDPRMWQDQGDGDEWQIERIDREKGLLKLIRSRPGQPVRPRSTGYVRSDGYHGQIVLIDRRQEAISRMGRYSYLLRAITQPRDVVMHTGQSFDMQALLSEDLDDPEKKRIILDILRSRPIYALQGPPGTGKSTLISHLVRALLREDPGVQILITAQAHGAVDVLHEMIDRLLDKEQLRPSLRPILVRLGMKNPEGSPNLAGLVDKTRSIIEEMNDSFNDKAPQSQSALEWRAVILRLLESAREESAEAEVPLDRDAVADHALLSFRELVRRAANIIFATTSARDLNYLARSKQLFDWVIVEEAGKAHGFDLALPMQAGHRWLLIGDPEQLPPYREGDYRCALGQLDRVGDELDHLNDLNADLIDLRWLEWWQELQQDRKAQFQNEYSPTWLHTFNEIYRNLRKIKSASHTSRLTRQYRMHPDIGQLVSNTFYHGELQHVQPREERQHGLSFPKGYPAGLNDVGVVWVDMPWCGDGKSWEIYKECEWPPRSNEPEAEAILRFYTRLRVRANLRRTITFLSPYTQQVRLLGRKMHQMRDRVPGLDFRQSLTRRGGQTGEAQYAHTVDSFQGNEADIVIISLVRNNHYAAPDGLGFLLDRERMNVLISRASRLLVLIGSWSFFERQVENMNRPDVEHVQNLLLGLAALRQTGRLAVIPCNSI